MPLPQDLRKKLQDELGKKGTAGDTAGIDWSSVDWGKMLDLIRLVIEFFKQSSAGAGGAPSELKSKMKSAGCTDEECELVSLSHQNCHTAGYQMLAAMELCEKICAHVHNSPVDPSASKSGPTPPGKKGK